MRSSRFSQVFVLAVTGSLSLTAACISLSAAPVKSARASAKAKAPSPLGGAKRTIAAADSKNDPPAIQGQSSGKAAHEAATPLAVAAQVDALIADELKKAGSDVASICGDEDFLRRVSFDIAGVSPSPRDVTLFGLDPDPHKRSAAIDRLLATSDYARNWARYWRDVIQSRATETRIQFTFRSFAKFESWIEAQLAANRPWDEIATALLTATGDTSEEGSTALILAQRGEPSEIAAETSRVFLGIQIQCANCHDHPTDSWKREQFHSLAAFFPRVRLQQSGQPMLQKLELVSFTVDGSGRGRGRGDFIRQITENPDPFIRRFDKDGDHKISRDEAKQGPGGGGFPQRLFEFGDADKDGFLTAAELRKLPPLPMQMQPGQGSAEYHMPDLQHPQSAGKQLDPVFFLGDIKAGSGLSDLDRRKSLARYITSRENPWFAKALVNRLWGQLVGEGFYMPVDDIGPERTANYQAALEALSSGFIASGYDVAWLFRAIANTETYQRQIRPRDPKQTAVFASAAPIRLRADHLYDALARVLGFKGDDSDQRPEMMGMPYARAGSPRVFFHTLFGFDPSTPPDEMTGTIQQALFMMNNGPINNLIRASGQTRLHQILDTFKNDDDAVSELYLLVHAREPTAKEVQVCRDYLQIVNNRQEAFEDILWSLINSTEFQTKR